MPTLLYTLFGVGLLSFYGAASLFGWEFNNPAKLTEAPSEGAAIVSSGWGSGRSGGVRVYNSWSWGGTRSGVGGGGSGGK